MHGSYALSLIFNSFVGKLAWWEKGERGRGRGQLEGDKIVTGLQLLCVALIDLTIVRSLVCCSFSPSGADP